MGARGRALLAGVALLVTACAPGSGGDAPAAGPTGGATVQDADGPAAPGGCGTVERPCTPDEVSPEAAARADEVERDLEQRLLSSDGDLADAVAWLREQPQVVEAGAGAGTVRFHVAGELPRWLFLVTSLTEGLVGAPPGIPSGELHDAVPVLAAAALPAVDAGAGGDERRSAKVVSPFEWEWSFKGIDSRLAAFSRTVARVRDYEDRVSVVSDTLEARQVRRSSTLADFQDWDQHDLVHVFTHGGYWCPEGLERSPDCGARRVGLLTMVRPEDLAAQLGEPIEAVDDSLPEAVLRSGGFETGRTLVVADRGVAPDELPNVPSAPFGYEEYESYTSGRTGYAAGRWVVLTADFFRAAYPGGLRDTVVILTSCSAGGGSDLQRVLAGEGSAVLGWSEPVKAVIGAGVALRMAELLVARDDEGGPDAGGLAAGVALDRLREEVEAGERLGPGVPLLQVQGGQVVDDDGEAAFGLVGDEDARARQVPYLLDAEGEELESGRVVTFVGQPGDGEPDVLELQVQVDGLADDVDAGAIGLDLLVDGTPVPLRARLETEIGRSVWRTDGSVELDGDLAPAQRVELRIEATLPDGEISTWTYRDVRTCAATPEGNRMAVPLPDGARHVGTGDLPSVSRYTVPDFDAARAHLDAAIDADPEHQLVDTPGMSLVEGARDAGWTVVGPCHDLAGGFSLVQLPGEPVTLDVLDLG